MESTLLIILSIATATILLFIGSHFVGKAIDADRRKKQGLRRDIYNATAELVDRSVKGYRNCQRSIFSDYARWSFSNNLFQLLITLHPMDEKWVVDIVLRGSLPFEFEVTGGKVKEIDATVEEKLMKEPEIPQLIHHLRFFDSILISTQSVKARYFPDSSTNYLKWSQSLGGLITFVRFLHHFDQRKNLRISGDAHCPFCRGLIEETESKISCRTCKTVHHVECWNELNRCSVFGCKGKTGVGR